MPVNVQHQGCLFSIEEMTRTGEQHRRDVAAFFTHGPCALDSITLTDPKRVFAMLSCYYNYPWLRADQARADVAIPVARLVSATI